MAWSLLDSGGANLNTAGSGTAFTFPGGAASTGDLLLVGVSSDTLNSTPSGWTLRTSDIGNLGGYVFEKVAAGGETSVTITTSGNAPTSVIFRRYGGALTPAPADTASHNANTAGGITASPAAATGTLTSANDLVVAFVCIAGLAAGVPSGITWSTGYTAATQSQTTGGTGSTDQMLLCADKRGAGTASESPSASWTHGASSVSTMVVSYQPSTSTSVSGSATLAGSGTLTAAGSQTVKAGSTLSGSGAVVAAGSQTVKAAATLAGAGTFTAAGSQTVKAASTLSGAGTLTSAGAVSIVAGATLSGAGLLTAAGSQTVKAAAALTGTGTLTASGTTPGVSASLSGSGSLTAAGRVIVFGSAVLAATGTLVAAGSTPSGRFVIRPNTGTATRPNAGLVTRPNAGLVTRP